MCLLLPCFICCFVIILILWCGNCMGSKLGPKSSLAFAYHNHIFIMIATFCIPNTLKKAIFFTTTPHLPGYVAGSNPYRCRLCKGCNVCNIVAKVHTKWPRPTSVSIIWNITNGSPQVVEKAYSPSMKLIWSIFQAKPTYNEKQKQIY